MDLFATVDNFEKFWTAWPKHPRKGQKQSCKQKWASTYLDTCADQILKHVEWMKTTDQWRKNEGAYIPAPLVYLNQQRWDGAEIPEVKKQEDPLAKMDRDLKEAKPMPSEVRRQLAQLLRKQ